MTQKKTACDIDGPEVKTRGKERPEVKRPEVKTRGKGPEANRIKDERLTNVHSTSKGHDCDAGAQRNGADGAKATTAPNSCKAVITELEL